MSFIHLYYIIISYKQRQAWSNFPAIPIFNKLLYSRPQSAKPWLEHHIAIFINSSLAVQQLKTVNPWNMTLSSSMRNGSKNLKAPEDHRPMSTCLKVRNGRSRLYYNLIVIIGSTLQPWSRPYLSMNMYYYLNKK